MGVKVCSALSEADVLRNTPVACTTTGETKKPAGP